MRKYQAINYTAFGRRITKRRTDLHLTQMDIAEKLECSESYISRLENGKAHPTLDFAFLLAAALGVGIDYFLPHTESGTQALKNELHKDWEQCSPDALLLLQRITEAVRDFDETTHHQKTTE